MESEVDKQYLKEIAHKIIQQTIKDYTNSHGLLISLGNSLTGEIIQSTPIIEDLGDYLPFLLYFGYNEFSKRQVSLAINKLDGNCLYSDPRHPRSKFIVDGYGNTDLILGFLEYYKQTGDKSVLNIIESSIESWYKLLTKDGFTYMGYIKKIHLPIPLISTKHGGMYGEILVDLFEISKNQKYIDMANNIMKKWITIPFFKRNGLFPNLYLYPFTTNILKVIPRIRRGSKQVRFFKENTNLVFSLLALYRITKENRFKKAIYYWIDNVKRKLARPDGGVYTQWSPNDKATDINLFNFQLIEILCDASCIFNDSSLLSFSTRVADFWLKHQSARAGLFPNKINSNNHYDYLDCETDMAIALLKLSELTNKEKYRISSQECFQGILKYHMKPKGLALVVDYRNGTLIEPICKIKFNMLFLKLIIAFLNNDKKIYSTEWLFKLLRDR